ncbi:MAG: DUF4038 domain-containing protein [Clostridia bacterium]|nr:DUF4038 domain-containing protein [Clostridia bacterium]
MLSISKNGRYLLKDGKFYPYIADTAWTLLQRLTRDEIIYYLDKRVSQGFDAVQVSAISELDGIRTPNREGNLPFDNENVFTPNSDYFELLLFLAEECEKRGTVLTLLPTWGDKFNKKWGIGPEIFTPDNAFEYGRFLANKLIDFENIIWMLGGDRPIETDYHRAVIDKMAAGLKAGEGTRHLITYHPPGEKSSYDYLPDADYIDFHCIQSSHAFKGFESEKMILKTLRADKKPCIDAECAYEDIPLELNPEWDYRFCAYDIRRRIYKNLLVGAAGAVYGHASVWCFKDKPDSEYIYAWRDALDRPMAKGIKYVKTFLSLFDIEKSKPDRRFKSAVAATSGKSTAAYIENGEPVFLSIKKDIKSAELIWFNPANGEIIKEQKDIRRKTVFLNPFEEDALLIIN